MYLVITFVNANFHHSPPQKSVTTSFMFSYTPSFAADFACFVGHVVLSISMTS